MRVVRYSLIRCFTDKQTRKPRDKFLAINHKEPGEHFKKKYSLDNDKSLLYFDVDAFRSTVLSSGTPFEPTLFEKYREGQRSMTGL